MSVSGVDKLIYTAEAGQTQRPRFGGAGGNLSGCPGSAG